MEHRFRFKTPTPSELALAQKGKVLLPLAVLVWIAVSLLNWPNAFLKLGVGIVISLFMLWLVLRLSDIQRREAQAKHGFVEVTPLELRVRLSLRSLLRVRWPDFKGTEIKNGWLQFGYRGAAFEQGGPNKRLDRVRLSELEAPDDLIEALRVHTLSLT